MSLGRVHSVIRAIFAIIVILFLTTFSLLMKTMNRTGTASYNNQIYSIQYEAGFSLVAREKAGEMIGSEGPMQDGDREGERARDMERLNRDALNPHLFGWTLVEKDFCAPTRHGHIFVLAVVHSAPQNWRRRTHIRETWAAGHFYPLLKTGVIFALGMSTNRTLNKAVIKESAAYRDIIQENFIDSYRNLTYKGIMWLRFASDYCPQAKYLLKVDDDIFVNIFNMVTHLRNMYRFQTHPKKSVICLLWHNMKVLRDKKSKWYVSTDEYSADKFAPYCSGSAYIITQQLVRPMYIKSFQTKFMWIDDWYITGALVQALKANHTNIASLYVLKSEQTQERLIQGYALFGHISTINRRAQLWTSLLNQKGIANPYRQQSL